MAQFQWHFWCCGNRCRQVFRRVRQHIAANRPRFEVTTAEHDRF
ncbi:MAG: hypothetical protein QNJ45_21755 [Ardenticatenaceae bacterium]|nr:hypothetical protein [Ardenticatenaceae bacterium]